MSPLRSVLPVLFLSLFSVLARAQEPGALHLGERLDAVLDSVGTDVYTIDLHADHVVLGKFVQRAVYAVVTWCSTGSSTADLRAALGPSWRAIPSSTPP